MRIPKGYIVNGINCGIKKGILDLGVIFSTYPCVCTSAWTLNLLKSNSIIVSKENLYKSNYIRAILANSGCANTACGSDALDKTRNICEYASKLFSVKSQEVLIASTGVIGEVLPYDKVLNGIKLLSEKINKYESNYKNFAKAIMTTDKKEKVEYASLRIDGKNVNFLCFAKGSGMVAPNLQMNTKHATMLVFFLTDLNIKKNVLDSIFKQSIISYFNNFSIDGDTSPNDTIFFVANGAAGNFDNLKLNDYRAVSKVVSLLSDRIIKKLLLDGEGVTKVVKIIVRNANRSDAEKIFKTISNSLLVKTAINGADPNWGRILSAVGRSGVNLCIKKVKIYISKYKVVENGESNFIADKLIRQEMLKKNYCITVDIAKIKNQKGYSFFTTDLSKDYVEINSHYKT